MSRPYRFGFALTTVIGNQRRYLSLRKYAERDSEVECIWAPISYDVDHSPFRWLPHALGVRATVLREAWPVLGQMNRLDAAMFHIFEPFTMAALRSLVRTKRPVLVVSEDRPPNSGKPDYPFYEELARAEWRRKLRFQIEVACARRAELFFPFSQWGADMLVRDCQIDPAKVHPINVGLDLENWTYRPKIFTGTENSGQLPKILFVGGDFERKGGNLLLEVFQNRFAGRAELHLVTKQPPPDLLSPNIHIYRDLGPDDSRLLDLYAQSDLFVIPTKADFLPWVSLEAMATGRPVIATRVAGLPDVIKDGQNGFLIEVDDTQALGERIELLLGDAGLRSRMGMAGRALVEREFDAAVCVPRLLNVIKAEVDKARGRVNRRPLVAA